jgi:hypothetical protein
MYNVDSTHQACSPLLGDTQPPHLVLEQDWSSLLANETRAWEHVSHPYLKKPSGHELVTKHILLLLQSPD